MRLLVTGSQGLIGRNFVTKSVFAPSLIATSRSDCDLTDPVATLALFNEIKPTHVLHLAALVGGIGANSSKKLRFFEENQRINFNVVTAAIQTKVSHFIAAGTGCAYPKRLEGKVLRESDFLEGTPEPTNDAYAYAKRTMLAHLMAAEESVGMNYSYFLPANIYGPHDNFHPTDLHVLPGLIRRMDLCNDETFEIWGTGVAERDFLYIDDLISALECLIEHRHSGVINIGSGSRTTILRAATLIKGHMQKKLSISNLIRQSLTDN